MNQKHFVWWWLPVLCWSLIILYLTSLPSLETPSLGFEAQDKVYHFGVYAILGFFLVRAMMAGQIEKLAASIRYAILIGMIFGTLDEIHQLFIPGRSCEVTDALADIAGVLVAQWIFTKMTLYESRIGWLRKLIY